MGRIDPQLVQEDAIEVRWRDIVQNVKSEYLSESQNFPWIVGFSGGKDRTVVAHAVFEALLAIPPSQRTRQVHVVSNDTLVESPLVIAHLDEVTKRIEEAANNLALPIVVARTTPELEKTFWVLLIGKGYPSPNLTMRWCTDRLKIQPTSGYIKKHISDYGAAIVVLGVRRSESQTRQRSIDRYQNLRGTELTPHSELLTAVSFSCEALTVVLEPSSNLDPVGDKYQASGIGRSEIRRELLQTIRDK